MLKLGKIKARQYYDQEAKGYSKMYKTGYRQYPANLIRLNIVLKRLKQNRIKTVLDAGCGSCGPLIRFLKEGFKVKGFDFSKNMVEEGKKELLKAGFSPALIFQADLENDSTLPQEKFDAITALGVFPHVLNEAVALNNMRRHLKKEGKVFIEFRNDLFAAFTMNRYSLDFFLNRVIDFKKLPYTVRNDIVKFYTKRLKIDNWHMHIRKNGELAFSDILAKFHNPLEIGETLFNLCGFSIDRIHFYHYHALPPIFEKKYPGLFRELSREIENPGSWKGYLLASAYVVEASKNDKID